LIFIQLSQDVAQAAGNTQEALYIVGQVLLTAGMKKLPDSK